MKTADKIKRSFERSPMKWFFDILEWVFNFVFSTDKEGLNGYTDSKTLTSLGAVFLYVAPADLWRALEIAGDISVECSAVVFLDESQEKDGVDGEWRFLEALKLADALLILFTPTPAASDLLSPLAVWPSRLSDLEGTQSVRTTSPKSSVEPISPAVDRTICWIAFGAASVKGIPLFGLLDKVSENDLILDSSLPNIEKNFVFQSSDPLYLKRLKQYLKNKRQSLPYNSASKVQDFLMTGYKNYPKLRKKMRRTVLELDLVGYSTICDNLEQGLDVNSVQQLNAQIQGFVDVGLKALNATRERTVMATAGDNAILAFEFPVDAHKFAEAVHTATREHNRTRKLPLAKRIFRIGTATGEIVMLPKPSGGFDIAGTTIARAFRLEAKATPGGLLLDKATYDGLSSEQKLLYGSMMRVPGKRDEMFEAYAYQFNVDGPNDADFFTQKAKQEVQAKPIIRTDLQEVLNRFKRLKSSQYFELIYLLEMPIGQQPADSLDLDRKRNEILKWVIENKHQDLLLEVLRKLTEPDSSSGG
jgi:class 3 adenylate cyclase